MTDAVFTSDSTLPPFRIEETRVAQARVLTPHGELDLMTAPELNARLDELLDAQIDTVLDLSRLSFLDSSGISVLLAATRRARQRGWNLEVRDPSAEVRRTLRLCGVEGVLFDL